MKMSGIVCLLLVFATSVVAKGGMPSSLMKMLDKTEEETEDTFWGLPKDSPIRKELAKNPGTPLGRINEDKVESVRESLRRGDFSRFHPHSGKGNMDDATRRSLGSGDWSQFTPPPIVKVECHVEFQVTKRVPGRCTKLGGTIPACQNEKYIGINYNECS